MKKKIIPLLLVCVASSFWLMGNLFKSTVERDVAHYLSNLLSDELVQIKVFGLGEDVEVDTPAAQKEILDHLAKLEVYMGVDDSDTRAPGAVVLQITLIYIDGREKVVTLPAFRYPTILGDRDFYLTIDGEMPARTKIWDPFRQYFKLLQD